jgi:hypothetical protein
VRVTQPLDVVPKAVFTDTGETRVHHSVQQTVKVEIVVGIVVSVSAVGIVNIGVKGAKKHVILTVTKVYVAKTVEIVYMGVSTINVRAARAIQILVIVLKAVFTDTGETCVHHPVQQTVRVDIAIGMVIVTVVVITTGDQCAINTVINFVTMVCVIKILDLVFVQT